MSSHERKYVLDANLFIRGFRDASANLELQRFHSLFAPFEYMSVIVAQELRAGVRSSLDRKLLEKMLLSPFSRRNRMITPSARAWEDSGDILADLAREEKLDLKRVSKAFSNDVLLALSCKESGMVLVTENIRDFTRISRIAPFQFTAPWPSPRG